MIISLEALKELISTNTNVHPIIQRVWIDYGANWNAETLVAPETDTHGSYQMLSPRDVEKITKGLFTIEDAQETIDEIKQRGW